MSNSLSPSEYAEKWGVCLDTVYRHLSTGQIPGVKIGQQWRIPIDSPASNEADVIDFAAVVAKSRAEAGLPPHITDESTLRRIAALLLSGEAASA